MKERLRKIYELATRGVGGERENAQRLLERLLAEHNLTIEDLAGDEKKLYYFRYSEGWEKKLILQIVAKVTNVSTIEPWVRKGWRKARGFELTAAEFAECQLLLEEYRKAYRKELERLFSAFVQRNRIFGDGKADESNTTPEQWAELEKVLAMARSLDVVPIPRKRLVEGISEGVEI